MLDVCAKAKWHTPRLGLFRGCSRLRCLVKYTSDPRNCACTGLRFMFVAGTVPQQFQALRFFILAARFVLTARADAQAADASTLCVTSMASRLHCSHSIRTLFSSALCRRRPLHFAVFAWRCRRSPLRPDRQPRRAALCLAALRHREALYVPCRFPRHTGWLAVLSSPLSCAATSCALAQHL